MEGLCDRIFQIPYPSAGSDDLIERIENIHQQEKIDVLIPNFDAELFRFRKNATFTRKSNPLLPPTVKQFLEPRQG